jgi:hypothetical protein
MRTETRNVATPPPMTGLRCRWGLSEEETGIHLIAHWFDEGTENGEAAVVADPRVEPKEGDTCLHTTLYFVWDSHWSLAL